MTALMPSRAEAGAKPVRLSQAALAVPQPPFAPAQRWRCRAELRPPPASTAPGRGQRHLLPSHPLPGTSHANMVVYRPCAQAGQRARGGTHGCPLLPHRAAPGSAPSRGTSHTGIDGAQPAEETPGPP